MVQDILTIAAVGGAAGYGIFSFLKILIATRHKKTHCSGCSGGCSVRNGFGKC